MAEDPSQIGLADVDVLPPTEGELTDIVATELNVEVQGAFCTTARYSQAPEIFITPVGMLERPALPMFTQPPPLICLSQAVIVPVMPATERVVFPFKHTAGSAGVVVPPTDAATTVTELRVEYCEVHGLFSTSARNS